MLALSSYYVLLTPIFMCLIASVITLILSLYTRGSIVSKPTLLSLSIVIGSIAVATPTQAGFPLLALCGGVAWWAFRERRNEQDIQRATTAEIAPWLGPLVACVIACLIFHHLGNYSSTLLTWENPIIEGLEQQIRSGESFLAMLWRQIHWGHGVLSAGHDSLLFGAPTTALFKYVSASPYSLRIIPALSFLASCALFSVFMRKALGPPGGVIALAVLGFNETAFIYGRYGSAIASTLVALILALYLCYRLVQSLGYATAILCPIALFAATLGYAPARLPVVVLSVSTPLGILLNRREGIKRRAFVAALFVSTLASTVWFEAKEGRLSLLFAARGEQFFIMTEQGEFPPPLNSLHTLSSKPVNPLTPGEKIGLAIELARQLTSRQLLWVLTPFSYPDAPPSFERTFYADPPYWKILAPILFPFVIVGFFNLIHLREKWLTWTLCLWCVVTIGSLLLTNRVDAHRAFFLIVPLGVWATAGLLAYLTIVRRLISPRLVDIGALGTVIAFSVCPIWKDLYERPALVPQEVQGLFKVFNELPTSLTIFTDRASLHGGLVRLELLERLRQQGPSITLSAFEIAQGIANQRIEDHPALFETVAQQLARGQPILFAPAASFTRAATALADRGNEARIVRHDNQEFLLLFKSGALFPATIGETANLPPLPPKPVPFQIVAEKIIPLSSIEPRETKASFSPPIFNKSWRGGPLSTGGVVYASGLGVHASTVLRYTIPQNALAFKAIVGLDDDTENCPARSVAIHIFDDSGSKLFNSGLITSPSAPVAVSIDVRGKKELILHAADAGNGNDCDHVAVGNAAFVIDPTSPAVATQSCVCPATTYRE